MKLNQNQLSDLCNIAISAAKKAGRLIADNSKRKVKVQNKDGGSTFASNVVTEVDFKSQELILSVLMPTIKQFDLALLTEETPDDGSRLQKDNFWCIDPLDGTLPFTQKRKGYAVSIALVRKDGVPLIGVVFDPVHGNLYHAINGEGAYKNEKPWLLNTDGEKFSCVPATTIKTHFMQRKILKRIIKQYWKGHKLNYLPMGGAVMNAIWVFENSPACYIKFPKKKKGGGSLWDYAATACIAKELGYIVCDINSDKLDLNNPHNTFMNEKGVFFLPDSHHFELLQNSI